MLSVSLRISQIRSSAGRSKIWEFATKTNFRLVVSGLSVFATAMVMMVASAFLYFYAPLLGIAAFAVFVMLMMLVSMLAAEARRRENGK